MQKTIALFLLVSFTTALKAQTFSEEKAVKKTIEQFFKGIHKGNIAFLKKTVHQDLKTQTTYTNGKGETILKTDSNAVESLLKFAKTIKSTDDYFEKILSYKILIDGNLASVWTPYEFYNKGKFSHCGVNSFQLFNNNGNWEIIYLVDTRRRGSCKGAKKKK